MRPSIVISEDNELCSASCRSVRSFDIGKFILDSVNDGMLTSGGGHKMAGGFSIKIENLDRPNKAIIYPFSFLLIFIFGYNNYRRKLE